MVIVLISGGTGLIGTNLTRHLLERNFKVIILTRDKNKKSETAGIEYSYWDVNTGEIDQNVLKKADHIIHLAGAGVMDKSWSDEYKQTIVKSRTDSAALLINTLKKVDHHVQTFVSASAIGIYGPDYPGKKRDTFVETDLPATGFLAETCVLWEAASEPAKDMNIRRVVFRQGIVLSNEGGAFKEFKMPLKFGVATIFGSGKQVLSWIHIDDVCRMFCDSLEQTHMRGVYNAVAPEPVTQKTFMTRLGDKLRGKFYIPLYVPVFALKLMLGQRSIEILKSATVSDRKVKSTGFTFLYPTLDAALDELCRGEG